MDQQVVHRFYILGENSHIWRSSSLDNDGDKTPSAERSSHVGVNGCDLLPIKVKRNRAGKFNLPASLVDAIPEIGEHDTAVVMHNDGVVQGLSDVDRWGVLTIGTGLGNARFTNRNSKDRP
jgi:hypothetical protein